MHKNAVTASVGLVETYCSKRNRLT